MRKVCRVGMIGCVTCTEINSMLYICSDRTDTGGRQHVHQRQVRRQREPEEKLDLKSSSSDKTVPGEDE